MTKAEVSQYIIDKRIPLSFWKNDQYYRLSLWIDNVYNTNATIFPEFFQSSMILKTALLYRNTNNNAVFSSTKEGIEDCLSEFLFWFELNKNECYFITCYDL